MGTTYNQKTDASDVRSSNGFAPMSVRSNRRKTQGSHMNIEELRINKGLLREISKYKKQTVVGEQRSKHDGSEMNDALKGDILSN